MKRRMAANPGEGRSRAHLRRQAGQSLTEPDDGGEEASPCLPSGMSQRPWFKPASSVATLLPDSQSIDRGLTRSVEAPRGIMTYGYEGYARGETWAVDTEGSSL